MTEFLVERVDAVVTLAPSWGLPLIFVLMMVESSFIPFPSEVVMIPAGFLAARGEISLPGAVIAGILGSLGGAWLNYLLARHLGQPALLRLGRYVFLPPERLLRAEEIFRRHGAAATFFCRLLPAIRQLISIPAGLSGMAALPFTLWTGLGAGIWVAFLTGVGFVIRGGDPHRQGHRLRQPAVDRAPLPGGAGGVCAPGAANHGSHETLMLSSAAGSRISGAGGRGAWPTPPRWRSSFPPRR
jgi:membrane protein DedA with SNARE-associated domain